jgi:riboflavin synthase
MLSMVMFTGIVTNLGTVAEIRPNQIGITVPALVSALVIGGSVAVNGVCLTVVSAEGGTFFADTVPETRRRTNLHLQVPGDRVNLEPALRLDQGLDGHVVQGHVDGVGEVLEVREADLGREIRIRLPHELLPLVAEKGSIAVDGISLTVAGTMGDDFEVALIPHTLANTIAGTYRPGTVVNLEVDVLARYVQRMLHAEQV